MGKENITISLTDWNIIMFDHEGVKTRKKFQFSFCMSTLNFLSQVIGSSMHNPNQFTFFQNLFYNFFKWIYNVIFSPRSNVFEAHFQEPLNTTGSHDCNGYPCTKSWIEELLSFIFKIVFLILKVDFKKSSQKI